MLENIDYLIETGKKTRQEVDEIKPKIVLAHDDAKKEVNRSDHIIHH